MQPTCLCGTDACPWCRSQKGRIEHIDECLDKDRRIIPPPGATATVLLQLIASDVLRDVGKRHALTSKLYRLGFPQQGQLTRIPLEDAGGQLRKEDGVQGWVSLVQADLKRRMKCRTSSHTARSGHMQNMRATALSPVEEQQSQSTYISVGDDCPTVSY